MQSVVETAAERLAMEARLRPTIHAPSAPVAPAVTVAKIVSLPKQLEMHFRRTRFGKQETIKVECPKTLHAFVGTQFVAVNETIGGCFSTTLVELMNSANTNATRALVSILAQKTGMGVEDLISALIDHNESSSVFVPKTCTTSFVITARDPKKVQ
ncbi:MAG: hypothetical protein G01um101477_447 [Candidatus Doudnabacteria bacterium Gr01-1014_77]|uniref:Uncharacterized protein n=1 Tax=Candidatus Doudnabacteria bacterium Gr01-1014_77 TaxID=2017133 RepID=A0A554JAZ9_9BACT|nr:MAG: hypothetical protein G01um101477_447 [Candidatus Doudnabacteria bacterium Gr01-1014_77]